MIFTFKKNPPPNLEPLLLYLELPVPPDKNSEIDKNESNSNNQEMIIIQIT